MKQQAGPEPLREYITTLSRVIAEKLADFNLFSSINVEIDYLTNTREFEINFLVKFHAV